MWPEGLIAIYFTHGALYSTDMMADKNFESAETMDFIFYFLIHFSIKSGKSLNRNHVCKSYIVEYSAPLDETQFNITLRRKRTFIITLIYKGLILKISSIT